METKMNKTIEQLISEINKLLEKDLTEEIKKCKDEYKEAIKILGNLNDAISK
jgi:bacterioferritin (cytochrome b1)